VTFSAQVTKDERVVVWWEGRVVTTVAGHDGRRLARALERAPDVSARELLLARATGNFKRGNER